jgi:hypothetical protein
VPLELEAYADQSRRWPAAGRVILASYDDRSIVVYQAYRPSIARFALEHGRFGGDFSFSRMSWIKPNFLWMMYRSAWGTAQGQECVLAVRIERRAFDEMLARAVPSSFWPERFASEHDWKRALKASDVRLQWDPDHDPRGTKLERRAVQLGLRGGTLARYARDAIVAIEDASELVGRQREHARSGAWDRLETPREDVYPVPEAASWVVGAAGPH